MEKVSKNILLTDDLILKKIYCLRKQKIMLDRDLAELYGVQTIRLREQVKRNINRFPLNFMFRLTEKEAVTMVSQNAIPSKKQMGGSLPYAFTEHGVLMLAAVLKSDKAMNVSVRVIELFVKMREMLSTNKDILLQVEKLENKITAHDQDIQLIFEALRKLLNPVQEPRPRIGFKP